MIAYVESNFVLELALQQEDHVSANSILTFAVDKKIDLAFPTFSLIEQFWTLANRRSKREKLEKDHGELMKEIEQLQRSEIHKSIRAINFIMIGENEVDSLD